MRIGCTALRNLTVSGSQQADYLAEHTRPLRDADGLFSLFRLIAKDKEIDGLRAKIAEGQISDLVNQAQEIKGVKLVAKVLRDMDNDSVRSLGDKLRDLMPNGVSVLACVNGAKATIAVAVAKEALAAGAHAGNLVREVAKLAGGNGGGRPDSAMAGAKDISKLDEAVAKAGEILAAMLK